MNSSVWNELSARTEVRCRMRALSTLRPRYAPRQVLRWAAIVLGAAAAGVALAAWMFTSGFDAPRNRTSRGVVGIVVYTVVFFGTLPSLFERRRSKASFWWALTSLLAIHVGACYVFYEWLGGLSVPELGSLFFAEFLAAAWLIDRCLRAAISSRTR